MSSMNLQHVVSVRVSHHIDCGQYAPFSVAKLRDEDGFEANIFCTPEQAEAIAAVFAPRVNSAGVPVLEGGE